MAKSKSKSEEEQPDKSLASIGVVMHILHKYDQGRAAWGTGDTERYRVIATEILEAVSAERG